MHAMIKQLLSILKADKKKWNSLKNTFLEIDIPPKTMLLREGEIATRIHFVKKGCLRECFNKDGKDITFQFFFEGQPVASIDSFMNNKPSLFSIESIETTSILSIKKEDIKDIFIIYPELKDFFQDFILQRFSNYGQLFLSRIKDTPQERYEDLLKNNAEIIRRVPLHYIASYLGITPISLSRIRNRKKV